MSDRNLAILVRQLALHCNLAAQIQISLGTGRDPYSSNCLERLRTIKRIREKAMNEEKLHKEKSRDKDKSHDKESSDKNSSRHSNVEVLRDFTKFVLRRGRETD